MHVDVVAVLVVFCIAFTVSQQEFSDYHQQGRHGRRHRQEEKYAVHSGYHKGEGGRKGGKRNNNNLWPHNTPRHNNAMEGESEVNIKECCPSVEDRIGTKIVLATTKSNKLVEVNNDEQSPQIFYEVRCADHVENKTCNFVEKNKKKYSVCVQRYTYTYALVKDFDSVENDWRLDHIKIKNGCTCELRINR